MYYKKIKSTFFLKLFEEEVFKEIKILTWKYSDLCVSKD